MHQIRSWFISVTVIAGLASLATPPAAVAADGTASTAPMGCILRQPGAPARFVAAGSMDKAAMVQAIAADRSTRRSRVVDPCVTGQMRSLPALAYKSLAQRHPGRFQPLDAKVARALPSAPVAAARAPEYHYVAIDEQIAPPVLFFDPAAIGETTALVGTAYVEADGVLLPSVALFENGRLQVIAGGFGRAINAGGTIGGELLIDAENFLTQAALFRHGRVQAIPLRPGEVASTLISLNDRGDALVGGFDADFNAYLSVWDGSRSAAVDFGPEVPFAFLVQMNNLGHISGTTYQGSYTRGFVHDRFKGATTLLYPLITETDAWALGINNRGHVLGYSFVPGQTERIGIWDAQANFHTHFVQGTPQVPTISNWLVFNDHDVIGITLVSQPAADVGHSYLLPSPQVRVDLLDLTLDVIVERGSLWWLLGINNVGNLFGLTLYGDGTSSGSLFFQLTRSPR